MTDRERLVRRLNDWGTVEAEALADYLLVNGVILPPCKVGATVYELDTIVDNDKCEGCEHYYEGGFGDSACCDNTKYGYRATECIEIKSVLPRLRIYAGGCIVILLTRQSS